MRALSYLMILASALLGIAGCGKDPTRPIVQLPDTVVLRSIAGVAVPALYATSPSEQTRVIYDTLRFLADSTVSESAQIGVTATGGTEQLGRVSFELPARFTVSRSGVVAISGIFAGDLTGTYVNSVLSLHDSLGREWRFTVP